MAVNSLEANVGNLTVRGLPTPFDPLHQQVTVATPSCCCCCCCCLSTIAASTGFAAGAVHHTAAANGRKIPGFVILAGAGLVLGIAGFVALQVFGNDLLSLRGTGQDVWQWVCVIVALVLWLGSIAFGLSRAGRANRSTALICAVVGIATLSLIAVEVFVAFVTAFLIELAFPVFGWLGWRLAKSRFGPKSDPQQPPFPPVPPYPPPSAGYLPYPPTPPPSYGTQLPPPT